jgi:hypothetical protein
MEFTVPEATRGSISVLPDLLLSKKVFPHTTTDTSGQNIKQLPVAQYRQILEGSGQLTGQLQGSVLEDMLKKFFRLKGNPMEI